MGAKRTSSVRAIAAVAIGIVAGISVAAAEPAPPMLRMSPETSEVRVAAPTGTLDQRFLLVPATDADKLDTVSVRVDLRDASKRLWPVDCQLDDRPCGNRPPQAADRAAPAAASAVLHITADLPAIGTYTGTIVVVSAAGKPATFSLTVDRAMAPLGLAVSGNATKLGQYCPLPGCEDFVEIWFALQETSGNALALEPPEIVGLAFKRSDDASYQSSFRSRLLDADGKQLSGSIKLAPGQTRQVRLRIDGIDTAGRYTGKIRWSALGKISLETEFAAVVKEPWSVAFLFILTGVLVGEGMRRYRRVVVPRQTVQRDLIVKARRYLEETAQPLPEWRQPVDTALRARVEETLELTEQGVAVDEPVAEQLALYRRWVEIAGAVVALPEAERAPFKTALDVARAALADTPRKDVIAAADKGLDGIADAVTTAARDHVRHEIDGLVGNLDTLATSGANLDRAAIAAARESLQQARVKLEAEERIAAKALFDQAAVRYAGIVAAVLEHGLQAKPTGLMTDPQWQQLKGQLAPMIERIGTAGDPASAIAAQAAARATWISGLVDGLAGVVKLHLTGTPELSAVSDQLAPARTALASGDLDAAEAAYRTARDAYVPLATQRGFMGAPGGPPPPPMMGLATLGAFAIPGARSPRTLAQRWRRLRWKSVVYAAWFFLASALIATLSGLQVLWVNDAIWGGWGARVLALFWGFGLHQVSGALVQGVDDLRARLDREAAP